MKKIVTTELTDKSVIVSVQCLESPADELASHAVEYVFPLDLVNPRVSLQIATLLVSDPTIPQCESKEE